VGAAASVSSAASTSGDDEDDVVARRLIALLRKETQQLNKYLPSRLLHARLVIGTCDGWNFSPLCPRLHLSPDARWGAEGSDSDDVGEDDVGELVGGGQAVGVRKGLEKKVYLREKSPSRPCFWPRHYPAPTPPPLGRRPLCDTTSARRMISRRIPRGRRRKASKHDERSEGKGGLTQDCFTANSCSSPVPECQTGSASERG